MLIASAVLGLVFQKPYVSIPGSDYASTALFSASLLLFEFGIRRSGSVTARQPAWVVGATAGSWVLAQIIGLDSSLGTGFLTVLFALEGLIVVGGPVFLGVLAIILANLSGRTRTTPIYPADS